MIVVDASVLAPALADDGAAGDRCRERLRGEDLVAPALIDLEVCSVVRRLHVQRLLSMRRARTALDELGMLPLRRVSSRSLIGRVWQLRENVSAYDASYVALAEALRVPLVTGDGRLARAPGVRCEVDLLAP